jgi:hypothetical protein
MMISSAAANTIGKQPLQPSDRTMNIYQAKFDFPFSPNNAPPKLVTIINLILRSWSGDLINAELYGADNKKIDNVDFPTDKPSFGETFSL